MIGFIALAGIIVRNSILLVEFARAEVITTGLSVTDAITLAAQVRLRPIMITALALIIGSMVLLSDPIFQGMAVSLLFGSLVATFLTLVVVPLGCISARKRFLAAGQISGLAKTVSPEAAPDAASAKPQDFAAEPAPEPAQVTQPGDDRRALPGRTCTRTCTRTRPPHPSAPRPAQGQTGPPVATGCRHASAQPGLAAGPAALAARRGDAG